MATAIYRSPGGVKHEGHADTDKAAVMRLCRNVNHAFQEYAEAVIGVWVTGNDGTDRLYLVRVLTESGSYIEPASVHEVTE